MIMRRIRTGFLLIAALGMLVTGCGSDSDAQSSPEEEHVHEAAQDGPGEKTVSGELSGFDCAVVGELCPTTHRGADYTTGVFTEDETFYFVVNIPQSFLTQYFRETVEVEGTAYPPYSHAVEPEVIHLVEDGDRRTIYESGYFIDEEGQRATFQDGTYRDGRWVVQ